jgi:hypothetical protein
MCRAGAYHTDVEYTVVGVAHDLERYRAKAFSTEIVLMIVTICWLLMCKMNPSTAPTQPCKELWGFRELIN